MTENEPRNSKSYPDENLSSSDSSDHRGFDRTTKFHHISQIYEDSKLEEILKDQSPETGHQVKNSINSKQDFENLQEICSTRKRPQTYREMKSQLSIDARVSPNKRITIGEPSSAKDKEITKYI